ncbi:hypothetical protein SAMN02745753_00175 [Marinomonas polaris DSM 16579]|uniref:Uncharacterized protein n=1 Tax=Marinomonas polaris DSM 16579 TaxID=1122206 RepID=A0A1M4T0H8_9GAMM|nr:hypothetical protein [Marinomonas polaris]SHE38001.1 hypothetical protein SAMN02745753_00175 [Marinomonas polaris DSM 16579]
MDLVLPSSKYIQSYNEYIEELGDEVRYPFPMGFDHQDIAQLKYSKIRVGSHHFVS